MSSRNTRFIFITGGVISSLGKGIAAASLGALLETRGLKINLLKFDPYLNLDPGTMSPFQHGEVFVTEDGAETDLDLGYYERFCNVKMHRSNNFTAGQIYDRVLKKERKGEYGGRTVQVIPHVTNEIKQALIQSAGAVDVALIEIGGTVGDIESLPFLEAIRQMRMEYGAQSTLFVHLTLIPYMSASGELKTKPTQHSVKELRSIGIQPDILLCRGDRPLPEDEREKIALFTNVEKRAVISVPDVSSIYQIPGVLHQHRLDELVTEKMNIQAPPADLTEWTQVVEAERNPTSDVTIAMVGKYIDYADSYKSLNEALKHAGIKTRTLVHVRRIDSEQLTSENLFEQFKDVDAILVPGGFGARGVEGKILAAQFAREQRIPYFGICLGMQVAVIEFARHCLGLTGANSSEFDEQCAHPVVALVSEWKNPDGSVEQRHKRSDLGGTLRKGAQWNELLPDSLSAQLYGDTRIFERHRHRYEVNPTYLPALEEHGCRVVARTMDGELVEMIELPNHPWFVACQFHPEFTSNPRHAHPLFLGLVRAAQQMRLAKDASKKKILEIPSDALD